MTGIAEKWESILSKIPPWPGSNEPVSFIPLCLFKKLKK
jgi:hypothetical protein